MVTANVNLLAITRVLLSRTSMYSVFGLALPLPEASVSTSAYPLGPQSHKVKDYVSQHAKVTYRSSGTVS